MNPPVITKLLALDPGSRLGVYDVIAQIGTGGKGEVYRVRDTTRTRHRYQNRAERVAVVTAAGVAEAPRQEHEIVFVQNLFDQLRRLVPLSIR